MTTLHNLAKQIGASLLAHEWQLGLAESCTGGLAAATITDLAGSSAWFDSSAVVYSNQAKQDLLQVSKNTLHQYGAVSEQVAAEMAEGLLKQGRASIVASVTGIAGPGGGTAEKPVGTVCFAWSLPNELTLTELKHFDGDRSAIREQSVNHSLHHLIHLLNNNF